MNAIYELKDRLCDELDSIARSGKLDMNILEKADKLAGTAYHLSKLAAAEEEYSGRSYRGGSYRGSYDDGSYDGYSNRRRRDSMGRYARDGYSRHEDGMREKLQRMIDEGSESERGIAQRLLSEMR